VIERLLVSAASINPSRSASPANQPGFFHALLLMRSLLSR
jgi:hypothetical protein